ncbi:MAG: CPBP family glutamic-type intramembrane protease [Candidatus Izemoplasmatales bacterium]
MYNEIDDIEQERQRQLEELRAKQIKIHNERKVSIKAIFVYIAVTILLGVGLFFYNQVKYSNSEEILSGIVVGNPITYTAEETTDDYGNNVFQINVYGSVINQYSETLPALNVKITFYDESGKSIGTTTLSKDYVRSGEIWVIDDVLYADANPTSFDYSVGFDESSLFYTFINFLQVFVVAIAFIFINRKGYLSDLKIFWSDKKKFIIQIVAGVALIYATMIVASVILNVLGVTGTSENEQTIQSMFSSDTTNIVLLFLTLVICTPIVEELVFRKALFGLVEPKFGATAAIISSGAIFGLMHVLAYGDFIQSIPYIGMGIVFGYMYHYSGKNIIVTMIMHGINNLVAFLSYVIYLSIIIH